jgi:hypothetical protein
MKTSTPEWIMTILLALLVLNVVPCQGAEDEKEALRNSDILRMTESGLGNNLVVAKILESDLVDFDLEVDDLIELKNSGVSQEVIEAILGHKAPSVFDTESSSSEATSVSSVGPIGFMNEDLGIETIRVALETEEGQQPIRVQRGEFSTVAMGMLAFIDYPGLKARVRTQDRIPNLLVKSRSQLTGGRYFLARLDSDEDDGVRSLKVSSAKGRFKAMFGNSRKMMEPDHDWVFPYTVEDLGDDVWRVTPEKELEPGEYGWYVDAGAGLQQPSIFDFGVD